MKGRRVLQRNTKKKKEPFKVSWEFEPTPDMEARRERLFDFLLDTKIKLDNR